jgi:hypothetical protein
VTEADTQGRALADVRSLDQDRRARRARARRCVVCRPVVDDDDRQIRACAFDDARDASPLLERRDEREDRLGNYLGWSERSVELFGQRNHEPVPVDRGITTRASADAPTGSGSVDASDGSVASESSLTGAVSSGAASGASSATASDPVSQPVSGESDAPS